MTVCQDTSDSLDKGDRIGTIKVNFSKAFDLVPDGELIMKIGNSGLVSMVVVWIRIFLLGRTHRVSVGMQLSEEFRVTSGVP
jgi:hypothetical protein